MMRANNGCAEKLLSESVLPTMTLSLCERCCEPLQGAFRASHKQPHWKMLAPEEKNNVIFLHDCGKMLSSLNNERIGKRSCGSEKVNALRQWEVITKQSVGKSILYFARYYDPATSRMLTQDSYRGEKTNPGTWNLYAYCANNPINYTDPTGHIAVPLLAVAQFALLTYAVVYTIYIINPAFRDSVDRSVASAVYYLKNHPSSVKKAKNIVKAKSKSKTKAKKKAKKNVKEKSSDAPDWAKHVKYDSKKSADRNARDILDKKYGKGKWKSGPDSEFSKIKKWLQRSKGYK